jgi:predicted CXXCH cytochrome family protein
VYYTHRRHAGIGELECENCHGAIADTERPPERALVRVTMEFCMDCHREREQTLDCNACHR